jgi:hypothetical protein
MDTIIDMLHSRFEHLLGRAGGPLHFRLLIMPLVVTFLAIRAGMKDAREGRPPFFRTILADPVERRRLLRSALKDIGRIFIVAVMLDTTYQLVVLRAFYPGELLLVAIACAIVPYLVIRGPVSLLMRCIYRNQAGSARTAEDDTKKRPEERPAVPPETDD